MGKKKELILLAVICLTVFIGYIEKDRILFESNYYQIKQFQKSSFVRRSSNPYDAVNCDAFRRIVEGGSKNLPYVISKIENGDFTMNIAMAEITKVDIVELSK